MTLATSLLFLSCLCPQDLKLPPRHQQPSPQRAPELRRPENELERFRRDVADIAGSPSRAEENLQAMGIAYENIDELIVEIARRARNKEMTDLMTVARRYGNDVVADALRFQLLSRSLGAATRPVVDTMVYLMTERDPDNKLDEKKALQDCIRGRVASAQRPATEALAAIAGDTDLEFALALAGEQGLDLALCGVELLAAIGSDRARARLVELLSKDPALAGAACAALIGLGRPAAGDLAKVLAAPPIDRSCAYAAFALAQIGDAAGENLLPAGSIEALRRQLAGREVLARTLAAVAFADLSYVASPDVASEFPDREIAEVLLDVVDGKAFVPNLDMLRRPVEQRLVRMTGRIDADAKALSWRQWWDLQRDTFVGIRERVAVDEKNAGTVVVTMAAERQRVRLIAEDLADQAPLLDVQEVLLTKDEMLALVRRLEQTGFGDREALRHDTALPIARTLEVRVQGARALVAMPAGANPAFDGLVRVVDEAVEGQLWQLYRNAKDEPDRAAFWRSERRWLVANPDPAERGRRFVRRVLANWDTLGAWQRGRALEHLFARGDRAALFDEAAGDRIVAIARAAAPLGEMEIHLLELAARVPGDRVWRDCVDVAATATGGGQPAVRAVFAVLGPDVVLAALSDARPVVRRVAIEEIVVTRDVRSGPTLVAMVGNAGEDPEVRRMAAYAVGQLRVAAGHGALVAAIVADDTAPVVRRECLRSLGRVGGADAFPVLERALRAPGTDDREAALRGLGELEDPRAAEALAELAVIGADKDLGALARHYLGHLGAAYAVPALRRQVAKVEADAIRAQLLLLLGGYQDPEVVPELVKMLRSPALQGEASAALATTTGIDVAAADDPFGAMDTWWRGHRAEPQWKWLLDALAAADVPTVLRAEHFAPAAGAEAVPELVRLLTEVDEPRLYVLTNAVLRTVAKTDLGTVDVRTTKEERAGIAARYRVAFETQQAARDR